MADKKPLPEMDIPVGLKYPRIWRNKRSKTKVRVMPWFEIPDPVIDTHEWKQMTAMNISAKMGVLVQIGYLIENPNGVWLGVGPSARAAFEDLGEWKEETKK